MEHFESVAKIIKRRRSIREFNERPVDIELVKTIIDTASHAPSNNNRQGWRFYILQSPRLKKDFSNLIAEKIRNTRGKSRVVDELMADYQKHFIHFKNAPVVIVCCFLKASRLSSQIFETDDENRHMTGELISLSLVIQNLLLLAESADLGTLLMTSPLVIARDIKQALQIPPKYAIGAFVCMGHYDQRPEPPRHLGLDRILHME